MTTKRTSRRTRQPSPPLCIRDPQGTWHAKAAAISAALTGDRDYSAGLAHALSFTAEYYSVKTKPINYRAEPLDVLRDYAVHGYDYTIRCAALTEIERRYREATT